jgi:hypothetical protein
MSQGFYKIRQEYLDQAWARSPEELAVCLPAARENDALHFRAFGEDCILTRDEILLADKSAAGPEGLLIALYASRVPHLPVQLHPLTSFRELPHSMPYHAAFAAQAEHLLVPHVRQIHRHPERIISVFSGRRNEEALSGDFSFTLLPLPRVPLYYIFHLSDEEFPASVTCLFAANALDFMPVDGLADVAEYTARKVISLLE